MSVGGDLVKEIVPQQDRISKFTRSLVTVIDT